jgi:hypothetical protein
MRKQPVLASCVAAALACSVVAGCASDTTVIGGATLRVVNESDFVITEIYLAPVGFPEWGPNLLGGDVLFPGEEFVLGAGCDFYDALLIDEDGVPCEIFDVDLCLNDALWVIRNDTCTIFEATRKQRELEKRETASTPALATLAP